VISNAPPFAVIFDLDGVLIDSVALSWQAYNQVLAQHGIHVSDSEIARYAGQPLRAQIRTLNRRYHVAINASEFEAQSAIIEKPLFADLEAKPGVVTLLQDLRANHIPIAVGTSTPRPLAVERLKEVGIGTFFNAIVGEGDVQTHKPSPEVFLHAARKLHVEPLHCLVFEDAPAGVQAAKTAGMKCCAITTKFISKRALETADLTVNSLEQVSIPRLRALFT
jgi:beta-phosphoglucomutase